MNSIINATRAWKLAILWFVLFSINALGTSIMASLVGTTWSQLDTLGKWMIVVAVIVNWTGTIMAFLSKAARKIDGLDTFTNDTTFISKTTIQTSDSSNKPGIGNT